MPINKKWNIGKLLGALKAYPLEHRRRVTFEYVLLAGVNDSLDDAADLARLLRGHRCKVNVIPFNPHPESEYRRPAAEVTEAFQNECKRLGLPTYLRTPRGDDIDAACGQLAARPAGESSRRAAPPCQSGRSGRAGGAARCPSVALRQGLGATARGRRARLESKHLRKPSTSRRDRSRGQSRGAGSISHPRGRRWN
jgi:hypothetical protein